VTASIGIKCAELANELVPEFVIAGADAALYAAKRNGRNRCELALIEQNAYCDLHLVYSGIQAVAMA
jgi:predicted signal transduction protein with EAL and GGDEF domain